MSLNTKIDSKKVTLSENKEYPIAPAVRCAELGTGVPAQVPIGRGENSKQESAAQSVASSKFDLRKSVLTLKRRVIIGALLGATLGFLVN